MTLELPPLDSGASGAMLQKKNIKLRRTKQDKGSIGKNG